MSGWNQTFQLTNRREEPSLAAVYRPRHPCVHRAAVRLQQSRQDRGPFGIRPVRGKLRPSPIFISGDYRDRVAMGRNPLRFRGTLRRFPSRKFALALSDDCRLHAGGHERSSQRSRYFLRLLYSGSGRRTHWMDEGDAEYCAVRVDDVPLLFSNDEIHAGGIPPDIRDTSVSILGCQKRKSPFEFVSPHPACASTIA